MRVRKKVSMQDVANYADVSKATVSKVLNNKPVASDELRLKVLDSCEKLGYQLDWSIQDLIRKGRSRKTFNIAFVLVDTPFSFSAYSIYLDGIDEIARTNNFQVVLAKLNGQEEKVFDLPPLLRDRRVDGIVISGNLSKQTISLVSELKLPYVIVGNYSDALTRRAIAVEFNMKDAFSNVISVLKRKGRTRIAYGSFIAESYYDSFSLECFKRALAENGLPFYESLLVQQKAGKHFAKDSFEALVGRRAQPRCDAFVTVNHSPAMQLIHHLFSEFDSGNRPDCTVVTFRVDKTYDLPVDDVLYVTLPLEQMAAEAIRLLLAAINNEDTYSPKKISFFPSIDSV